MLKRRPIDTYIRRATAGLPRLERVDTAAEIRVHLLQKTRELMAQGFPREEAEHLAVQEMGPVAQTNRALLGHAFTASLGWAVVGVMLAGAGVWTYLERDWIFWKDTSITRNAPNSRDIQFAIRQNSSFAVSPQITPISFYAPRGTKTLEYAIVSKHGQYQKTFFALEWFKADTKWKLPEFEPDRIPMNVSLLLCEEQMTAKLGRNTRGIAIETSVGTSAKTVTLGITRAGRIWTKQPLDKRNEITGLTENSKIKLNEWTPIYSVAPLKSFKTENPSHRSLRPNPEASDGLMVAIRASDIPASDLRISKLRFAVDPNGQIEILDTPLPKVKLFAEFGIHNFAHSDTNPTVFNGSFAINEVR